jgi:hypothetical protein
MSQLSDQDLVAFMHEALPAHRMTLVESLMKGSELIHRRLNDLRTAQTCPSLTLASIWRTERLSCPTRAEWSAFLVGVLPPEMRDYVIFHQQVVGCRLCTANLADLRFADQSQLESLQRRERFFHSSAARLVSSQ